MKVERYDPYGIGFECPGCGMTHVLPLSGTPRWGFNQDYEKPTFTPSILARGFFRGGQFIETLVCHSFVIDGRIQFLDDCDHDLRGKTVPLPDIEE